MEFQEKSAFAQENPIYDAIPLIIIDKMGRKCSTGLCRALSYYLSNQILLFSFKYKYIILKLNGFLIRKK